MVKTVTGMLKKHSWEDISIVEDTSQHTILLYYTILYSTILYCTILYYAILYYTTVYVQKSLFLLLNAKSKEDIVSQK